MKIYISVSNNKLFMTHYSESIKQIECNISEDRVAFGISEIIIIGIVFLYETSLSGLTWDCIKEQILPFIKNIFSKKRKDDIIKLSIKDIDGEYDIEIPENFNDIDINIPDKLEMKLKK